MKDSLDSQLQIGYICSIKIFSLLEVTAEIRKKSILLLGQKLTQVDIRLDSHQQRLQLTK